MRPIIHIIELTFQNASVPRLQAPATLLCYRLLEANARLQFSRTKSTIFFAAQLYINYLCHFMEQNTQILHSMWLVSKSTVSENQMRLFTSSVNLDSHKTPVKRMASNSCLLYTIVTVQRLVFINKWLLKAKASNHDNSKDLKYNFYFKLKFFFILNKICLIIYFSFMNCPLCCMIQTNESRTPDPLWKPFFIIVMLIGK